MRPARAAAAWGRGRRQADGVALRADRRPGRRGPPKALAALLVGLAPAAGAQAASDSLVPANLQAAIFVRMLGYDRALKARAGGAVKIGILSKTGDKGSAEAQAEMLEAFRALGSQTVQGIPLAFSTHEYQDAGALAGWAAGEGIDVLYVVPGLAPDVESIGVLCRQKKIVSMAAARSLVEKGLAVGVVVRRDTPRLVVNLQVAESSGMQLDPKLLGLSEVIR